MFPTNKHLDGRDLSCVALFPGVDTLAEDDAVGTAGKLTVEECEVSRINMQKVILKQCLNFSDAASLTDSPGREVRICALDKEDGDTLRYEFKFAADPEPEKVRK